MSGIILPKVAALELTYTCNHRCFFCSCPWEADEKYKEAELKTSEWFDVIDTLAIHGTSTMTLTGGEPLTKDGLRDIIDFIVSNNISLNIISNGRAITDDFLDFIAERNVSMCISVPGIRTFSEMTGVDNLENVLKIFEKTRIRGIRTTANIAVTKKNLPELYENIANPLIRGANYVLLNRFLPGGRGLDNSEYLLSVDEVNNMLDIAEEVLEKANRYGNVGTELPLCIIKNKEKYKHLQVGTICSAAKGFYVVDPSGYIKVCNHSPQTLCKYTDIDSLTNNEYWKRFVSRDYLPEMCIKCEERENCDGGCREAAHVYNGDFCAKDPLFE